MRDLVLGICILISFTSCKINQYDKGNRIGKWKEKAVVGDDTYLYISHYTRQGQERGTWKTYKNGQLEIKEHYRANGTSLNKHYHMNGKLRAMGMTKLDKTDSLVLHWFYYGPWQYYNKQGKLETIRYFENGKEIEEEDVKKP